MCACLDFPMMTSQVWASATVYARGFQEKFKNTFKQKTPDQINTRSWVPGRGQLFVPIWAINKDPSGVIATVSEA